MKEQIWYFVIVALLIYLVVSQKPQEVEDDEDKTIIIERVPGRGYFHPRYHGHPYYGYRGRALRHRGLGRHRRLNAGYNFHA